MSIFPKNPVYNNYIHNNDEKKRHIKITYVNNPNIVHDVYIQKPEIKHINEPKLSPLSIDNIPNNNIEQIPLPVDPPHNNSDNSIEHIPYNNVSYRRYSMPLPNIYNNIPSPPEYILPPSEYIAKLRSPNRIRRISKLVKRNVPNTDTRYARRKSLSTPTSPNNKKDIYTKSYSVSTPPTPVVSRRSSTYTSINHDLNDIITHIEDTDTVKIFDFDVNLKNRRYSEDSL
jgi:hypothetical protein